MRIRFSFTIDIPPETRAEVIQAAGHRAAAVAENILEEDGGPIGAPAGPVRITITDDELNQRKMRTR